MENGFGVWQVEGRGNPRRPGRDSGQHLAETSITIMATGTFNTTRWKSKQERSLSHTNCMIIRFSSCHIGVAFCVCVWEQGGLSTAAAAPLSHCWIMRCFVALSHVLMKHQRQP